MATPRLPTEERRQQIADAALRVLAHKGAHRLTAVEIAAEVGIADGTLFRHFKNKDEIIDAAISSFEAYLEGDVPPPGGEPLERLESFFVRRLEKVRARPEILRLAFSDRLEEVAGDAGAQRVRQVVGRSLAFVRTCLKKAAERGEISSEIHVDVLLWVVTGALRGAAFAATGEGKGPRSPERVWDDVERLLRASARAG